MSVASLLNTKGQGIISLKANDSIADAVALLCGNKIGAVIVLDEGGILQGILSERDVMHGLGDVGSSVLDKSVADLMTSSVETCTRDDSIESIMRRMTEGRFRHVPVMDGDALIGMVSIGDLVKFRMKELENEASAMRDYIAGA